MTSLNRQPEQVITDSSFAKFRAELQQLSERISSAQYSDRQVNIDGGLDINLPLTTESDVIGENARNNSPCTSHNNSSNNGSPSNEAIRTYDGRKSHLVINLKQFFH